MRKGLHGIARTGAQLNVIRECLMAAFWLSLPLLAIGFCVGIVMNLIQVATSLQDSAFSTFPRLVAKSISVDAHCLCLGGRDVSGLLFREPAERLHAPWSAISTTIACKPMTN